jgi:hypothetical protein
MAGFHVLSTSAASEGCIDILLRYMYSPSFGFTNMTPIFTCELIATKVTHVLLKWSPISKDGDSSQAMYSPENTSWTNGLLLEVEQPFTLRV